MEQAATVWHLVKQTVAGERACPLPGRYSHIAWAELNAAIVQVLKTTSLFA